MQSSGMLHIAHGWSLGLYNAPLIGEEIQAWKYGPVVESVYQDFKHYGRANIARQKPVFDAAGGLVIPTITDPALSTFLDNVWNAYKHLDGFQLSAITHQPDTPWHRTWVQNGGSEILGAAIPQNVIAEHYRQLAAQRNG
jgi:uncharacterized phage-associated protein